MLAKIIIIVNIVIFGLFGLVFLIMPEQVGASMGVGATTPVGWTDFRATYGGAMFGVGVFLGFCLGDARARAMGCLAIIIVTAGFFVGRLVGYLTAKPEGATALIIMVIEIISITIAWIAMGQERKRG